MNDRGLLEAAVKAAGNGAVWYAGLGMGIDSGGPFPALWNPLDDDGDALRLAVNLNMNIRRHYYDGDWFVMASHKGGWSQEDIGHDPYAATRRAIVRAAAAMAAD